MCYHYVFSFSFGCRRSCFRFDQCNNASFQKFHFFYDVFLNAVSNGVWQDGKKIVVSGVAGTTTTTTMPEPQQQCRNHNNNNHNNHNHNHNHNNNNNNSGTQKSTVPLTRQWICQNQRHLIFRLGSMGRSLLALR
jgi:hypothetical protein